MTNRKKASLLGCMALTICIALGGISQISMAGQKTESANTDSAPDTMAAVAASTPEYLIPEASGEITEGNDQVSFDLSHAAEGYFMVSYLGASSKAKVLVTMPANYRSADTSGADGSQGSGTGSQSSDTGSTDNQGSRAGESSGSQEREVYTYTLTEKGYVALPFSGGSGNYTLALYEHLEDSKYVMAYSFETDVVIENEYGAFLYPNLYASYAPEDKCVALAAKMAAQAKDTIELVEQVYEYVIEHVAYDEEKAAKAPANYVPHPDETLASGKGICFDYASLMTVMLRSQGIPTRLEVGYSGTVYHAWISVYLEETGWVNNLILFDGTSWSLMDPTLGASNSEKDVANYIGDGTNYLVKYIY